MNDNHKACEFVSPQCMPELQRAADSSPLLRWVRELTRPQPPAICYRPIRRGGPGGFKLSRARQIAKWFKWRPCHAYPKGRISKKVNRIHREVFWMYYPDVRLAKREGR